MTEKINELKTKFSAELEIVKERLFDIKNSAIDSKGKVKSIRKEKQKEVKERFAEMQKEVAEKKDELEQSVEDFLVEHSALAARKKAENAEAYASSCIALAFAAVEEAQHAIINAVNAAEDAEKMEGK